MKTICSLLVLIFSLNLSACPFDINVTFVSNGQNDLEQKIMPNDKFLIESCNGEKQELAHVQKNLNIVFPQGITLETNQISKSQAIALIKKTSLMLITNSGVRHKPISPNKSPQPTAERGG